MITCQTINVIFKSWSLVKSNWVAETESWFPKQHDSLVLTEWLAISRIVKGGEWRVLTIYIYIKIMSNLSLSHGFKQLFIVDWFIILLRLDLKRWRFILETLVKCESIRFCDCCSDSRILIFKIDGFLIWAGGTEYESWKYCGIGEAWNFVRLLHGFNTLF